MPSSSNMATDEVIVEELMFLLNELRALNTVDELSGDRKLIKRRLAQLQELVDQVTVPIDVLSVCRITLAVPVQL